MFRHRQKDRGGTTAQHKWRFRLLIYPKFQLVLIAVNTLILIMSFGFVFLQTHRAQQSFWSMGQAAGLPLEHDYFKFVAYHSGFIYSNLAVAFAVSFVLCSLTTLVLTHKVAGPIVRLRGFFHSLAARGTVEHLKFRERDFFTDLPPVINKALETLDSKNGGESPADKNSENRVA